MQTYKVYGDRNKHFYTLITASNAEEAWDIAKAQGSEKWFELADDSYIEPYQVEETK
jgi:hypothetical protein